MQVRYQAALRPEAADYIRGNGCSAGCVSSRGRLSAQQIDDALDFSPQRGISRTADACWRIPRLTIFALTSIEPGARAADGEALFVEQVADAADQQHFVVLVIAPVAPTLHGLQLREFLLPVAQHVRLHAAQLAHFTDGEVALGWDGRQASATGLLSMIVFSTTPSVSGWRER